MSKELSFFFFLSPRTILFCRSSEQSQWFHNFSTSVPCAAGQSERSWERDRQGCEVLKVGEVYTILNVVVTNAKRKFPYFVSGILGSELTIFSWLIIYFGVIRFLCHLRSSGQADYWGSWCWRQYCNISVLLVFLPGFLCDFFFFFTSVLWLRPHQTHSSPAIKATLTSSSACHTQWISCTLTLSPCWILLMSHTKPQSFRLLCQSKAF